MLKCFGKTTLRLTPLQFFCVVFLIIGEELVVLYLSGE